MALIKCPECGKEEVSSSAQSCPQCAHPVAMTLVYQQMAAEKAAAKQKNASGGCGALMGLVIVIAVVSILADMAGCDGCVQSYESHSRLYDAEDALKARLLDPSSYERTGFKSYDLDDGGCRIVIDYRAKNGFGGYVASSASFDFDANGNLRP